METTKFYIRQTTVVFRHGDRSPITTLKDKEFWHNQLAEQENVMLGFKVLREEGDTKHTMEGNPPFGMLTKKGVADMEAKGAKLRKEIMSLSRKRLSTAASSSSKNNESKHKMVH